MFNFFRIDFDNEVTLNQSRAEDITLKEDYGNLNLITEENFGMWFFSIKRVKRKL